TTSSRRTVTPASCPSLLSRRAATGGESTAAVTRIRAALPQTVARTARQCLPSQVCASFMAGRLRRLPRAVLEQPQVALLVNQLEAAAPQENGGVRIPAPDEDVIVGRGDRAQVGRALRLPGREPLGDGIG